jgi:hypothetical protein
MGKDPTAASWSFQVPEQVDLIAHPAYIGHDQYDPIFATLNERGAVVFLHGAQTPSSTPYPHDFLGLPITEVGPDFCAFLSVAESLHPGSK